MLAQIPSFERNPRGSPDFLAYPVPKACMHALGTGVPTCLGVARPASSPKAAQALGCSLTPGLWISMGRVTCMARAASVPGLWSLGFLLLRGACVWVWVVLGLGFWLRPATPGWGVGVCVRLSARSACTPPLLAGVCGVVVCAWVRVSAAPRHSWLGCRGWCLLVCALRLYPATPGWGVRCGCVSLGSGLRCAPPLLAGVFGCVCACVRAPLVPRHSWLGCAAWMRVLGVRFRLPPASPGCGVGVCVFVFALRLYPATPGWGVRRGCVCLESGFGCAPPLVAGVWGACVFVCSLRLYPATPGWGVRRWRVCLGSGLGCAPPFLAGVLCCACVRSACTPPLLTGVCGVGLCLGSGLGCAPPFLATVLWCACARSACTPPLLAGVRSEGVCAWARVSAAPRHSWLGCWGVCVFVCALCWCPATPGWGVRCGRVRLGSGFGCAPPLLVGVLGCACARSACTAPLLAGVCCGSGSGCAPPPLPGVLGCVCARVRASLVPGHFWPACTVCVCVRELEFWLCLATPCWGVGSCVRLRSRSAFTPRLLAGVCGVGVSARSKKKSLPCLSWRA